MENTPSIASSHPPITPQDPGIVLLLSVVTCGLYLFYWYYVTYEALVALSGETPTGHEYGLDLLLVIVTCGVYGVWVDYRISQLLRDIELRRGIPNPTDTSLLVVLLDVSAYVTGFVTNLVASAVHQDRLNKIVRSSSAPSIDASAVNP